MNQVEWAGRLETCEIAKHLAKLSLVLTSKINQVSPELVALEEINRKS